MQAGPELHELPSPPEPRTDAAKCRHLLIAGTGRSGTSALVKLLNAGGLDTAMSSDDLTSWDLRANAGGETLPFGRGRRPYVIKTPWAYQFIDELLNDSGIILDEVLIPIRRLSIAAASRVIIEISAQSDAHPQHFSSENIWSEFGATPGGTLNSLEPIDQERILGRSLHLLVEALEESEIPFRFISFPKFVADASYAWRRLGHLIPAVTEEEFKQIHASVLTGKDVRVEDELERLGAFSRTDPAVKATLPQLQIASLFRSLTALREELGAASSNDCPVCGSPDHAPEGASYGDATIGPEGLAGWRWTTRFRPNGRDYGYQFAVSDTHEITRVRHRVSGAWTPWRTLSTE